MGVQIKNGGVEQGIFEYILKNYPEKFTPEDMETLKGFLNKPQNRYEMKRRLKIMKIINTTPHEIKFVGANGIEFTVKPCGYLLNASAKEEFVKEQNGIQFVRTVFCSTPEGVEWLDKQPENAIIVGSIIAAQAYKGRVYGLTPAVGFERVPVAEKKMSATKFQIF